MTTFPVAAASTSPKRKREEGAVESSLPAKRSKRAQVSGHPVPTNVILPIEEPGADVKRDRRKKTKKPGSLGNAVSTEQGDEDANQEEVPVAAGDVDSKLDESGEERETVRGPLGGLVITRELKKKKKKQKQLERSEGNAEEALEKADQDSRHSRLMEKRQKSLQKAERLVESIKEDTAAGDVGMLDAPEEVHDLRPLPQPEPVPELPALPASASLPTWLASPIRVSPTTTARFPDLGIPQDVTTLLGEKGYSEAFAVQAAVLPLLLTKNGYRPSGDVLVSAATGSGKTLSYVLPMIEDVCRNASRGIKGLIVMPTRELVSQARQVAEACASAFARSEGYTNRAKIGAAVGSETIEAERSQLMANVTSYDQDEYRSVTASLEAPWMPGNVDSEHPIFAHELVRPNLRNDIARLVPKVDVLFCTPGRLVEHLISTPGFSLPNIRWLVVDEADKLLGQSFQQWLPTIMSKLSRTKGAVRKIVLSATLTRDVGQLNQLKLFRPKLVVLEGSIQADGDSLARPEGHVLPTLLVESSLKVDDESIKPLYLMELLKRENIVSGLDSPEADESSSSDSSDSSDSDSSISDDDISSQKTTASKQSSTTSLSTPRGVLIFTKSNETAIRLGRLIGLLSPSLSLKIGTLTSTTPTASRHRTISSFTSGKISILVASDLVSRGLDLPNLTHVINYDVPNSIESYVHRIGRTARAGKRGHAWTLYTPTEGRWFVNEIGRSRKIERASGSSLGRLNIKENTFDGQRSGYEEALEKLGQEANPWRAPKPS